MNFLRSIINSGVGFANASSVKRGILLSNAIGLILFALSLVTFICYYIWYGWNVVTFLIPIIGLLALIVVFLNYAGFTNLSRIWISLAHAEIFYDAKINATGVIWKCAVTSEQYRSVFIKCLEFVHSYNTPNYISDISLQGLVEKEDQHWMFEEILPYAIRNELKKIAAVHAEIDDFLAKEYLSGINENIKKLGAEHQFFLSLENACDWIRRENEKAASHVQR